MTIEGIAAACVVAAAVGVRDSGDQVSKVYIARHYLEFEFTRILPVLISPACTTSARPSVFSPRPPGGSVGYSSASPWWSASVSRFGCSSCRAARMVCSPPALRSCAAPSLMPEALPA